MNKIKSADKSRILWLDFARVIAIISISFNHSVNRAFATYDNQFEEFLSISMWSTVFKTVVYIFSIIGVPLFLMISGSLLIKKDIDGPDGIKKFYKNNLLRLFITAEIWYLIFYLFFTVRGVISGQQTIGYFIKELFSTLLFVNQTTMNSMWYIPMILCIYLIIPFLCIVKNKVSFKTVFPSMLILYIVSFVVPSYNNITALYGGRNACVEESAVISSLYLLYVVLGYWISRGGLNKLKNFTVISGAVVSFFLCCVVQYYAYSKKTDCHLDYDFLLIPVCTSLIFEAVRRFSTKLSRLSRPIEYISKIAFGIYFVHIVVMTVLVKFASFKELMPQPLYCLFLEAVSLVGSVIFIAVVSRIPLAKKYLFMIKD